MKGLLTAAAVLLTACSFRPAKIFSDYTPIEVREVGRSLHCNAPDSEIAVRLFADAAGLRQWLEARAVRLNGGASWAEAPYAVVELGQRSTGGYGLAVSRPAVLRGALLILSATFVSPAPGAMVTQVLTSPCAIVQLPPGRYDTIEVQDQTGAVRASGAIADAAP